MAEFKVGLEDAQRFQDIWTKSGVALILPPESAEMARDFANVVLNNFIQMCQSNAQQEAIRAAEANKSRIIMEGVR